MKYIDLFCGIGGFHQVLRDLNCECLMACDIDKDCREVYKRNYNIEPVKDVKDIDEKTLEDFDIITAGFPCQAFSNAGKKKTFEDKRGLLFDEIIRIAEYKKPKFIFLENVKHILKVSNGEVFEYIQKRIDEIGYILQIFNMSPHNYGIPQQRERIFFICIRKDIYKSPIELIKPSKKFSMEDIIEKSPDKKYQISKEIEDVLDIWNEMIEKFEVNEKISPTILINDYYRNYTKEEFDKLPLWKRDYMKKNIPLINKYKSLFDDWYERHKSLLTKKEIYGKLEFQAGLIKPNESIYNHYIQFRQSGIRIKKNKYFPTLVAIVQTPIFAKYKRYITPRECARLQNFPDDFILPSNDKIAYKQLGNSINVYNAYIIIKSTFDNYKEYF